MRRVGIGFRPELVDWLRCEKHLVQCLEFTAEHFFEFTPADIQVLQEFSNRYPTYVHGLGLSLGTPGPLCEQSLDRFAKVADLAQAKWVSEHVSFTRSGDIDLGHLNPIRYDESSLKQFVEHAIQVSTQCQRPLILENITSTIRFESAMRETEFLNHLCEQANCRLLLDVTNLYINSRNHGFDPKQWLTELDPRFICQIHIVGYSKDNTGYHDRHVNPIQDDLLDLTASVIEYGKVEAITLERDDRLDELDEIKNDLERIHHLNA